MTTPNKMTQIGITTDTRQRLRNLRITKHETYDEVINRNLGKKVKVNKE